MYSLPFFILSYKRKIVSLFAEHHIKLRANNSCHQKHTKQEEKIGKLAFIKIKNF